MVSASCFYRFAIQYTRRRKERKKKPHQGKCLDPTSIKYTRRPGGNSRRSHIESAECVRGEHIRTQCVNIHLSCAAIPISRISPRETKQAHSTHKQTRTEKQSSFQVDILHITARLTSCVDVDIVAVIYMLNNRVALGLRSYVRKPLTMAWLWCVKRV